MRVFTYRRSYQSYLPPSGAVSRQAQDTQVADIIARGAVQPQLKVGAQNDRYEREADRVARQVVDGGDVHSIDHRGSPGPDVAQRMCSECEQELQAKAKPDQPTAAPATAPIATTLGTGQALPASLRREFEPRMGSDFSAVRIHTDNTAAAGAEAINARAYTTGRDIVFNHGEFQPQSNRGRFLLAHELTHVMQQQSAPHLAQTVQRTPAASSSCAANTDGTGPNPVSYLNTIEMFAALDANLTAAGLDYVVTLLRSPMFGLAYVQHDHTFLAYLHRFGEPEQVTGGFRNRFDRSVHTTREAAMAAEMDILSTRYVRLANFFDRSIRYICKAQNQRVSFATCSSRCDGDTFAITCPPANSIVLCEHFWDLDMSEQAWGLIHEAAHVIFGFRSHAAGTTAQRGRNPVCYSGLVASVHGRNPPDTKCPALP